MCSTRVRNVLVSLLCCILTACGASGGAGGGGGGGSSVDAASDNDAVATTDGGSTMSCEDTDSDTICDSDEGNGDIDRDGIENYRDSDSDGDGVPDSIEAGDSDPATPPADSNGDGIPDYLDPTTVARPDAGMPDAGVSDAGSVYMVDDAGMVVEELCPSSAMIPEGCIARGREGATPSLCDGLDNDCDGSVDEGCDCEPGAVQACFMGPPGRRNVGACQDGMQTCVSNGEFGGLWGECSGGISPTTEVCDGLDNDCNGCTDEIEGCVPAGTCPGPDDPRVPDASPFSTYTLDGTAFLPSPGVMSWSWQVVGSPCDRMFQAIPGSTATSENGQLSYTLSNGTTATPSIDFTLSGDYEVTMTAVLSDGTIFTCTFIVRVRAPGLRVELCWDQTGPTASSSGGTVDVDLHLGRHGTTPQWFDDQDCDYASCKGGFLRDIAWGYADTPIANCTGPGARGSYTGACPNPRLDIDNISTRSEYVPENINLDNPNNGDRFRVMVHHYTSSTRQTYPLVNVYCGGSLVGTYGAAPDRVEGFDEGGGRSNGDMWHVVDITTNVDGSGTTTGCDLAPVRPSDPSMLYYVAENLSLSAP